MKHQSLTANHHEEPSEQLKGTFLKEKKSKAYPYDPGSLQKNSTALHARFLTPYFKGSLCILDSQIYFLFSRARESSYHSAYDRKHGVISNCCLKFKESTIYPNSLLVTPFLFLTMV